MPVVHEFSLWLKNLFLAVYVIWSRLKWGVLPVERQVEDAAEESFVHSDLETSTVDGEDDEKEAKKPYEEVKEKIDELPIIDASNRPWYKFFDEY